MLRTVVDAGSGVAANVPGLDIAGKTGSTNFDEITKAKYGYPATSTNDSWFAGYTPQYTMAVWTGYSQNGPGNYMTGNTPKIAQYMFKAMMQTFATDGTSFAQPNSVYTANGELFIKGVSTAEAPQKIITNQTKSTSGNWSNKGKEKYKQAEWKPKKKKGKGNKRMINWSRKISCAPFSIFVF